MVNDSSVFKIGRLVHTNDLSARKTVAAQSWRSKLSRERFSALALSWLNLPCALKAAIGSCAGNASPRFADSRPEPRSDAVERHVLDRATGRRHYRPEPVAVFCFRSAQARRAERCSDRHALAEVQNHEPSLHPCPPNLVIQKERRLKNGKIGPASSESPF